MGVEPASRSNKAVNHLNNIYCFINFLYFMWSYWLCRNTSVSFAYQEGDGIINSNDLLTKDKQTIKVFYLFLINESMETCCLPNRLKLYTNTYMFLKHLPTACT